MFLPAEARRRPLELALGFVHLQRISLRRLSDFTTANRWVGEDPSAAPHPHCAALDLLANDSAKAAPDGFAQKALSERLAAMTAAQAGCERVAATP